MLPHLRLSLRVLLPAFKATHSALSALPTLSFLALETLRKRRLLQNDTRSATREKRAEVLVACGVWVLYNNTDVVAYCESDDIISFVCFE